MTVITDESVCLDCKGRETCQRLKRLNYGHSLRDNMVKLYDGVDTGTISDSLLYRRPGRKKEVFEVIISKCSMKDQFEMRKKRGTVENKEKDMLYYCNVCKSMHREGSDIGLAHKKLIDK